MPCIGLPGKVVCNCHAKKVETVDKLHWFALELKVDLRWQFFFLEMTIALACFDRSSITTDVAWRVWPWVSDVICIPGKIAPRKQG